MNKLVEKISAVVTAVIILVIGILCIVANAQALNNSDPTDALKAISLIIGIVFIVVGALAIITEIVLLIIAKGGLLLKAGVIASSIILATGIFFVSNQTVAAELISIFLTYVPYVMVVLGAVIVLDATFTLVFGLIKKEKIGGLILVVVIKYVIGVLAIVLGALAMDPNALGQYSFMIFGIILILYAIYSAVVALFAPRFMLVAISKEQPEEAKEEKAE